MSEFATLEVVRARALTTVQDLGRAGHAHLGVPRSGALDEPAHRLANRVVGNPERAATLETTLTSCAVRVDRAVTAAVTGAPCPVRVDGRPAPWGAPIRLPAGAVLDVGAATHGVRGYLAFAGGVDAAPVLGSRATDVLSGLGPDPLADGTMLRLGRPAGAAPRLDAAPAPGPVRELVLPVLLGPRDAWFTTRALRTPGTPSPPRATGSGCAPRGRRWNARGRASCPARAWRSARSRCRRTAGRCSSCTTTRRPAATR